MKERSILFSGPMVKAILEGRKTQTRRVVKPQPHDLMAGQSYTCRPYKNYPDQTGLCLEFEHLGPDKLLELPIKCPFGVVGDRLWVRETWGVLDHAEHDVAYKADRHIQRFLDGIPGAAWFEADRRKVINTKKDRWRPSIFMPRWASRITLEITEIRVQRLQDISASDCFCEGVQCGCCGYSLIDAIENMDHYLCRKPDLRENFARLWDSLNGKKHPFESNPWVWAISFKRVVE